MKRPPLSGFTLVEMTLALTISSLVFIAIGSSVLAVTRALPSKSDVNDLASLEARAIGTISAELAHALTVTERVSRAVTFTVADRDSDGQPETIRYAWSGVAGDPLTRQYNGGVAATVLTSVRDLDWAYDARSESITSPDTESAETTLFQYDNILNLLLASDHGVTSSNWLGQYFKPSLPGNATGWKVTRVMFRARTHGAANGQTLVQMRRAAGNQPSRTVVAQTMMLESTLTSSYQWKQISFSGASFGPTDAACLLFAWVNDAYSCDIQLGTLSSALSANSLCITGNETSSTATWSGDSLKAVQLYVYGTVTTPTATTTKYHLTNARLRVRAGTLAAAGVEANVRLLAEPEVSGP